MAKISLLDPAGPLTGEEHVPMVQDGETRRGSIGEHIENLAQPFVDAAQASAAEAASGIQNWRSPIATSLTAQQLVAAKAIKQVVASGFTSAERGKSWRFTLVARADGTHAYAIRIMDGTSIWSNGNIEVPLGVADGPVWVTLARADEAGYFDVLVDYRELSADGIAVNLTYANAGPFEVSDLIFRDEATRSYAVTRSREASLAWRDIATTPLTIKQAAYLPAIKSIAAIGFAGANAGADYRLIQISKNSASFGDRIRIAQGSLLWDNGTALVAGKDDGPVEIRLTRAGSSGSFKLLVDYRDLDDGDIYSTSYANSAHTKLSSGIFTQDASALNPNWRDTASAAPSGVDENSILDAISKIEAVDLDIDKTYRITIVCRNNASFGDRISFFDDEDNTWTNGSPTLPGKDDGPVWTTLTREGVSGYFNVLIDYRKLIDTNGDGVILSFSAQTRFLLSPFIYADEKLRVAIASGGGGGSGGAPRTLGRALRVALAGSSITWGSGWLGQESYVATVDDYLRYQCADTRSGGQLAASAGASTVSNPLFFRGSCTRLVGADESASFELAGDEVTLCIARPRGVHGAAVCELLIDGAVHDTFTTLGNPVTSHSENFVGDGGDRKFDLGRAFTFNHVVTVDGNPIVVVMNTGGFGTGIPPEADAMVIRGWSNGEVHHYLYFAVAPANGAAIVANFDAGESVTYMRGSVGQVDEALTSANESPYGDGPTVFDPANPAALSAGLDFRGTDERSILTWRFNSTATRSVQVRVKELDPAGTGTPELWLNFATNRMHRVMNAGIGGKSADELLNDASPVNISDVIAFQPDIVCIEFGTNDDWVEHIYRAWQTRTGLTAAQVRDVETANYYAAVRKIATDDYEVDDQRLPITTITATSVTFTATDTTFNIVPGDAVIFGDFYGDNRRLAARVVKTWDAGTRTATWGRPLRADEMAGTDALSDIATARVFGSPAYVANMGSLIDIVRDAIPTAQFAIGTGGIPNIRHRRLEGYRELDAAICAAKDVAYIDFYAQTLAWQYSQPATVQQYIDASNGTTSTGASSYTLYNLGGLKPNTLTTANWLWRGWSVKVDGVERINRGCHVIGGAKRGWDDATDPSSLPSTGVQVGEDYVLTFTDDIPPLGAEIIIKRAAEKWAQDDCHPVAAGRPVMAAAVNVALEHMAQVAAAMPG